EGGRRGFHGAVEKRCDKPIHGRLCRVLPRSDGPVDVAHAFLYVPNVTLAFEDPEDRRDSRVTRLVRKALLNFGTCRAFHGEENIHDLTFAAAEGRVIVVGHFRDASTACRLGSPTTPGRLLLIE